MPDSQANGGTALSVRLGAKPRRVLFITLDGALEPLGQTQVVAYITGLARRGIPYALLSFERQREPHSTQSTVSTERQLENAGIPWHALPYAAGGVRNVLANCVNMYKGAARIIRDKEISLIHARSYVPCAVALLLKWRYGVPYIFDMRAYWVDERAAEGQWFTNPVAYALGKWLERRLLANAAGVVTLTDLQAHDIRISGAADEKVAVATIPTCANYETFITAAEASIPPSVAERLRGKLVIAMVGSVNASYFPEQSFDLFQSILRRNPKAHLLCLTRQQEQLESRLRRAGVSDQHYTITTASHEDMPAWLQRADWAMLLMNESFAKRGSMPTKLAEFFASGVRPISFGCNAEVRGWVSRSGSGVVLQSLDEDELERAAAIIAASGKEKHLQEQAVAATRGHFDLSCGIDRYEALLNQILKPQVP